MLTNLIQKVKAGFQAHERGFFVVLLVILLGIASFGFGRLSSDWRKKEPIRIEKRETTTPPIGIVESAQTQTPAKQPPPSTDSASSGQAAPTTRKPATPPPPKSGTFVASKKGTAYHFPWCPGAKRIKEKNKIWFQTKEEAAKAGYKPAANCPGLNQ